MPRPIIGLTTYAEEARFGLQDTFAAVLPLSYVHAVHESGGRAVLVTPDDPDPDVLTGLDGIMFTGGSDMDPAFYDERPHPTTCGRSATGPSWSCCGRRSRSGCPSWASAGACS
jgi:putative glutamine amidotransferase